MSLTAPEGWDGPALNRLLNAAITYHTMKSSIGSDAFTLLALAFISLFVLLLLRHFLPLRTTPAYLVVPIFLALALPISINLLVPIDLASSSRTDEEALRGIWLPQGVLLVAWRLTYWLTFALTWYDNPLRFVWFAGRSSFQVHSASTGRLCGLGLPDTKGPSLIFP